MIEAVKTVLLLEIKKFWGKRVGYWSIKKSSCFVRFTTLKTCFLFFENPKIPDFYIKTANFIFVFKKKRVDTLREYDS